MNGFTVAFLSMLGASVALRVWLDGREVAYARAHRQAVPAPFQHRITVTEYQRMADYAVTKTRFGTVVMLIEAVLLIGWTVGGGLDLVDRAWRASGLPPLAIGVGVIVATLLLMQLLGLPLLAYRLFVIEQRFGFNRVTAPLFTSDAVKKAALLIIVASPLAALAVWVMENGGSLWWLYFWVLWMGSFVVKSWAYPIIVAPLFNRFTSLRDEKLERKIADLLNRCGLLLDKIQVMDGSRRSAHGNAYFTGIGSGKRIVLLDTLVEVLDADEIKAVLAHEVGHFKRRHLHKFLAAVAVAMLAGLALLAWLIGEPGFYGGLGISRPSPQMALALSMLLLPIVGVFVKPFATAISRRMEFEADDFAASQADPQALIRALSKLDQKNARMLTSDPLYSAFHHSHPSLLAREERLRKVANP